MATLAEVNKTLIEVSDNTEKTSEGISAFVSYIDEQRRRTLEAEREAKAEKAKADAAMSKASSGGSGKSASAGGGFFDKLSMPSKLLAGGGLLGLGSMLGRSLLKRLPGAMLIGFADTIAEALIGDKFDANTKDTIKRGIQGAGFGMLLGRRFILPFTLLGALATDENKKILKDTGENLNKQYEKAMENLKPFLEMLPSLDDITKFLSTQATAGLKGIRGFTESGFNSKEFQENWESSVGLLGSVAFLLMPGKFLKALKFLAKFALTKKGLVSLISAAAAGKIGMDLFGEDGTFGGDTALATGALVAGGSYLGFKAIQGAGNRSAPTVDDDKIRAKQSTKLNKPGSINPKTNKIVGVDGKDTTVSGDSKDAKKLQKNIKNLSGKYPRIFSGKGVLKFLKGFGPLAALSGVFAMSEVQDVLASQLPEDEKKKQIGNILGMELNALTLGSIGAAIGGLGFGPKGAILGGTVASVLGAFAPNVAGGFLADFFLGGNPKLSPEQQKQFSVEAANRLSQIVEGKGGAGMGTKNVTGGFQDISSTYGMGAGTMKQNAPLRPPNNFSNNLQGYMGMGLTASGVDYGGSIALGNNSNNTNNTFNSTVGQTYIGSGPTIDMKDQFGFGF